MCHTNGQKKHDINQHSIVLADQKLIREEIHMQTLTMNEQEMVAGGYLITGWWPIWEPRIPNPEKDTEALKKDIVRSLANLRVQIANSVTGIGIGIGAPLTASPWSNRDC